MLPADFRELIFNFFYLIFFMSFNLQCREMDLCQVPQFMTWLILNCEECGQSKDSWKIILSRYKVWLADLIYSNSVHSGEAGRGSREWQNSIDEAFSEIDKVVQKHGKLHFYWL